MSEQEQRTVLTVDKIDKGFMDHLQGTIGWYWNESLQHERNVHRYDLTAVLLAFLTTIVAAFPTESLFGTSPWTTTFVKWVVVVLSALVGVFNTLRARQGPEELYRLREEGRIRVTALEHKARLQLTQVPMTDVERNRYQNEVLDQVAEIEREFGRSPLSNDQRTKQKQLAPKQDRPQSRPTQHASAEKASSQRSAVAP
jgi:hypothetical protein